MVQNEINNLAFLTGVSKTKMSKVFIAFYTLDDCLKNIDTSAERLPQRLTINEMRY